MKLIICTIFFFNFSFAQEKPVSFLKNGYLFQVKQSELFNYLEIKPDSVASYANKLDSIQRTSDFFREDQAFVLGNRTVEFTDLLRIAEEKPSALMVLDTKTKLPIVPKYKMKKETDRYAGIGGGGVIYFIVIDKKKHKEIIREPLHRFLPC